MEHRQVVPGVGGHQHERDEDRIRTSVPTRGRSPEPVAIIIDPDRREQLLRRLQGFFLKEFDEELSRFRAEQVLDFHLEDANQR